MRYTYIKYGDVVDELRKTGAEPSTIPSGGPGTFTASFLHMVGKNPALLISWGMSSGKDELLKIGSIEAQTYKRPRGILKIFASIKMIGRLIKFRPEVVICVHDGPGLWATYLACLLLRTPFVHSRQRAIKVEGDSWRRRASAVIDCFVIRRAAWVVCHGPFTRDQLVKAGVLESRIIEFDIHFDDIMEEAKKASVKTAEDKGSSRSKILFIGRMEESKGVFELLDACIPVLKSHADIDLVYVGQGDAVQPLQERVKNEDLASQVSFTGRIPHDQIGVHLKTAAFLVTPTRRGLEGWPMAALEGQAMGVPVIAPDAGPFPFMIKDGVNGLLFTSDSVTDLHRKIVQMLDAPLLRDKLSRGAIETSERRAQTAISFGEALKLACE